MFSVAESSLKVGFKRKIYQVDMKKLKKSITTEFQEILYSVFKLDVVVQ